MKVNLQPIAKTDEALLSYIDINFRRITDALEQLAEFEQGIQEVTGAIIVATNLALVENVIVSLVDAPSANACFIRGFAGGALDPNQIQLEVYTSAFGASVVATDVAWLVIGQ